MKRPLDCLAYEALDAEQHMTRLTNQDYLHTVRTHLWEQLTVEQRELYQKLLGADRSRFVSVGDFASLMSDTHESRFRTYKARLESLAVECLDALMAKADIPRQAIRLILTNHTVCGICPPLSSVVANHLQLPPSVQAIDLAFMGCSSAVWACELASRLLKPGEAAVVLSAELTSAATNLNGTPSSLVANTVFGDGIGAFLVAKPPHRFPVKLHLHDFAGSLISTQQALDCIRYEPNPVFYEVHLQETIPQVASQGIQEALRPLIRRNLVSWRQKLAYVIDRKTPHWQKNVDYFVLHTAGNKILKGIKQNLGLSDRQTDHNFSCFQKYGNTSSASIYYSLKELEASEGLSQGDRLLFLAYGSGFMAKCMYGTAA